MTQRDPEAAPQQKITRKDIAKMSTWQVLAAARAPYARLAGYLKPYRKRFFLGLLLGVLAGATQSLFLGAVQLVGDTVFVPEKPKVSQALIEAAKDKPEAAAGLAELTKKIEHKTIFTRLREWDPPQWMPARASVLGWKTNLATQGEKVAIDPTTGKTLVSYIIGVCALIPLIMGLRGILGYLNAYCMQWVSLQTLDDIRQETFEKVLAQGADFFGKQKTGDLIQTIFNQTRTAQMALTQIASDIVKQPASLFFSLVSMFVIDAKFTLVSFIIFPLCIIPVLVIGKKVRRSSNQEEEEAGALMGIMHEALGGIRVVKAHAREDFEAKRFSKANQKMLAMMMRWRKAMELTGPLVETVASIGIAAALVYAWKFELTSGKFMALVGALVLMYEPAKSLGRLHVMMQKCLAATTKIFELMDRPASVEDRPEAVPLKRVKGEIEFRNLCFGYTKKVLTLNHINLKIPRGSTCALVGQTGSGKSTLLALLLRFYDAKSGEILIDGQDIRSVTQKSLREQIAFVNQDPFLFHDTIGENIRYGRLNATQEEIEQAAIQAHAHDFIKADPEGYQRVVGDRGLTLSGGQRQRVCIARAFLRDAPILLLDEATSALDNETEANLQADLEALGQNRTVIVIAHRLSTVQRADQIVVMHQGEITDIGTHAELLERSEIYQRLNRTPGELA